MQFIPQMEKNLEEKTMMQSTKLDIISHLQHDQKTHQESTYDNKQQRHNV
jgi:hypothetical protein